MSSIATLSNLCARSTDRYFGNRPATTSPTQISSSSASQRSALPCTRKLTCLSASRVAWASRGNFEAGNLIVRSSASSRQIRLSSTQHRMACGASVTNSAVAMKMMISLLRCCPNPGRISRERLPEHSWGSFQRFGEELERAHEVSALIVPSSGV